MKKTILVDIGIIVQYLKTGKGKLPQAYDAYTMKITTSTYTELLASSTFNDPGLEKEVVEFIHKYFEILTIDENAAKNAAKIMREKKLNLATSLIAGAAVSNSLELLTDSKEEFKGIQELKFLQI